MSCSSSLSLSSAAAVIPKRVPHPHGLLLPVKKDPATLQYLTRISLGTPLLPLDLVLDLGGRYLWLDCGSKHHVSSTRRTVGCNAPQCSLLTTPFGCTDNSSACSVLLENPYTFATVGDLALDAAAFQSTDGFNPGPTVTDPDLVFSCGSASLLKGLARGARGMAGFGRNLVGLPVQLAVAFRLQPVFALCLASNGVIFVGPGPYGFLMNVDASRSLMYTPLLVNSVSTAGSYAQGERSVEYFIGVKSIKVNNKLVPNINTTLLSIDGRGYGGTKISAVTPYTTMETSIYRAVTDAFAASLRGVRRAAPVGKFRVCYDSKDLGSTRVGPGVPQIDLVLQSENVTWRIFGANSMTEAKPGVLCLAFLDGGVEPRTAIVIGGHQIENNLLQFDLTRSRLGFTSSLLFMQTTCSNFNFTAKP